VRVEDLDRSRVREGMEKAQLAEMRALGLDWDGPVVRQSERLVLYEEAIAGLDDEGLLYPCYCTRAEIRASVSALYGIPAADRYSGTCRELTARERAEKEASGSPPALRVRAENIRVSFEDRLLGPYEGEVDDFVVRRNDGAPAYQLAVVVDDAMQDIGEVVRGLPSWTRRRARSNSIGCSAFPHPATPTCRSCSDPTGGGWPSGMGRRPARALRSRSTTARSDGLVAR
jgi:glutamyl-tRNA synthetase